MKETKKNAKITESLGLEPVSLVVIKRVSTCCTENAKITDSLASEPVSPVVIKRVST